MAVVTHSLKLSVVGVVLVVMGFACVVLVFVKAGFGFVVVMMGCVCGRWGS